MAFIDLTQLTETQLQGVQYATKVANEPLIKQNEQITAENEKITAENKGKPEEEQQALKELVTLYTEESYMEFVIRGAANSYYSELYNTKKKLFEQTLSSLPPEQLATLAAQFGVPDVL